jgi:hypothetical protein
MVTCTRATRACARAHAHCWHNWNSLDALHAMQHLAVRGHFSCSAVMAVLGPRNRSEMVTCTRAARACSRAHAHCWHGWEIPVRGHFSTRNSSMITSTRTHAHAHTSMVTSTRTHARAHTHHWHNWSDATIDCRCFKRLSGLVLLFVLLLQTCREAEDRC